MEFIGNNFEILIMGFVIWTTNILIHFTNLSGIEIQKIYRTAVIAVRLFAVWNKHSVQRTEKISKIDEQHGQSEQRAVRTPKIKKKSEQGEQSEHLLFGYWGTLITNIQMSPTDQCRQQHCHTLDVRF